jgi:hypothetical protein
MGFRFRKTLRLGGLVRLNFSGSGVSLGLGPRGANVNISRRGVRQTVGLPGTGLSYQTFTRWPKSPPPSSPPPGDGGELDGRKEGMPEQTGPKSTGILKFLGALGLIVFLMAMFGLVKGPPSPPPAPMTAAAPAVPAPVAPAAVPKALERTATPAPNQAATATTTPPAANTAPLTADEVREVQTWLKAFGLDPGPLDGFMGPLTTAAIKKYEAARLQPVTGTADRPLLERLRRDTAGTIR